MFDEIEKIDKEQGPITCIIHGDARGADRLAGEWAVKGRCIGSCIEVARFPAEWDKYGKPAGPIRNRQMLRDGKPDMVLAFLAPHSKGTKDMIGAAEQAGVPVRVINI